MAFILHADFGYVILVVLASIFMLQWLGLRVVKARNRYEVQYPRMYSDTNDTFNCIQRAHQNTLEAYPTYLVLQLLGGLYLPRLSAAAGLIWILGRIAYGVGYSTGDPKNRARGTFGYIGLITLLMNTTLFALNLLRVF